MKKAIMERWVEALRSGEFKQTKKQLKHGKGYCCLGVLCRIHAREHNKRFSKNKYLGVSQVLPRKVMNWAKLKDNNSFITVNKSDNPYRETLAECNDRLDYNFDQIADLIEDQYKMM